MNNMQKQLLSNCAADNWEEFVEMYPSYATAERLTQLILQVGKMREEKEDNTNKSGSGLAAGWYDGATGRVCNGLITQYLGEAEAARQLVSAQLSLTLFLFFEFQFKALVSNKYM